MARDLIHEVGGQADETGMYGSQGLFLFIMIIMSLSVIAMILFSCGDKPRKKKRRDGRKDGGYVGYAWGGDGGGGDGGHGGGGHGGHGGGGDGGHGGGGDGGHGGGCGGGCGGGTN